MSDELSATEESVREVLASLRTERVMSERGMSTRVQALSSRGVAASPSTTRAGPSRQTTEKHTKHRDDIVNAKLILSIFPSYIPPLKGEINCESVPQDYDYPMITAYLLKGVRAVHTEQTKLAALKFCDFNLGDQKILQYAFPTQVSDNDKGEEFQDHPLSMDDEPRAVHLT
jgi:hypothetical protein